MLASINKVLEKLSYMLQGLESSAAIRKQEILEESAKSFKLVICLYFTRSISYCIRHFDTLAKKVTEVYVSCY